MQWLSQVMTGGSKKPGFVGVGLFGDVFLQLKIFQKVEVLEP
jgi:hypothetical protein